MTSPVTPEPVGINDEDLRCGDPVVWTRLLVAIPSVNPSLDAHGEGEARVADAILPFLEQWGFQVERREPVPGRVSLVARFGSEAPTLLLCGHLDTVGVSEMIIPPFEPRREAGRIWGRGSADMKSGVAVILSVAASASRQGCPPSGSLMLVLTADEEWASLGLEDLLKDGLTADAAIVTEPTSLSMAPANKGFLWMTVRARGKAAHGSRPELGRDAIRGLARFVAALDALDEGGDGPLKGGGMPRHILLGSASLHAGTIRGGESPSVYPAQAEVTLEARLLPGDDPQGILAEVRGVMEAVQESSSGVTFSLEPGMFRPAAALSLESPLIQGLEASLERCGVEPRVEPMTAWVESSWLMEAGIPALCFVPGSIADAHTVDESVSEEEIRKAAQVLQDLVCSGRWL
jgi:acetylornithine deacetylase